MTDVLVVADTHGDWESLEMLIKRTRPQTMLFLGDGLRDLVAVPNDVDVYAVTGNCDFFNAECTPKERVLTLEGYRIFMTHGHLYSAKRGIENMVRAAVEQDADVLIHGHTHQPYIAYLRAGDCFGEVLLKKDLIAFCPGSLGRPPMGERASFGTLTLKKEGALPSLGQL